jgi:hypothetical protein
MALATIFYFAVAWLAFSLAGHGFIGLLIVGVLPFAPMGILAILEGTVQLYIFGINSLFSDTLAQTFFYYHNPALWGLIIRENHELDRTSAILLPAISYIVLSAAMFAGAYFVSRIRKPERTGNSVVFNPVKNVLVFLVAMAGMFIVAMIMYGIYESTFMFHVGMIIGFVIGYFIAQMIAEKTFHVLGKIKYLPHFTGIAVSLYVFMILVTQFGLGFYVNRVPHENEIYGVHVGSFGPWGYVMVSGIPNDLQKQMANSDPEFIAATQEFHRTILQNKDSLWEIPHLNRYRTYQRFHEDGSIFWREYIHINYVLQNGRSVTRQYNLPSTFIKETGANEFLNRREVILAPYFLLHNPEYIRSINFTFWSNESDDLGNWVSSRAVAEVISRTQMDTVLEMIADNEVETAIQNRLFNHSYRWHDEDVSRSMNVSVWFDVDRRSDEINPLVWRWSSFNMRGEAAERMFELLNEWDLVRQQH